MTAPDPGLTDLIAAHTLRIVELNEAARYPECNGCDWVGGLVKDHAVHLASVVERHTNGRIALNLGADPQGYEIAWAAKLRWQERAEKAEAAVARVEKALAEGPLHRIDFPSSKDPYGIERQTIRAALEGES